MKKVEIYTSDTCIQCKKAKEYLPVSYTHLDVYKRQNLGRRGAFERRPQRIGPSDCLPKT